MISRRYLLGSATAAGLGFAAGLPAQAQTDEEKSALKIANADPRLAPDLLLPESELKWWRDAKFGVFVHWGLYAIPAKGEWHMFADKVPPQDYAKLAQQFNPKHFAPDAWAGLAKEAGARYMVLTARHHDGFALYDSPASYAHFDALHSAARRDFVAPYVKAVRAAGLKVGLYYSPIDWRFPAYFHPKELPDNARLFKRQTYGQVEELMRHYGRIDILWWDGGWLAHSGTDADAAWFWEPDKLNRMVRNYQPEIVINPRSGWQGDYDVNEGPAPITGPIRGRPWEKAFSLGRAWGYTANEISLPPETVISLLVNAVVRNGNAIVNVGPDRDGVIAQPQVDTLKAVGRWLKRNARAVYDTRPGPLQPVDGVYGTTQSGNSVFVHVLSWPREELRLPLAQNVSAARTMSGATANWRQDQDGVVLTVAPEAREDSVTVIELICA